MGPDSPRSLDEGFAEHIPHTGADIAEALRTSLLSLDANVLLNFYRYSPTARDALVALLRAAGNRVWVSHQAALEFWRNRCAVIDRRNAATEQVGTAMDRSERSLNEAVDLWAKQTAVDEAVKTTVKEAIADGLRRARETVDGQLAGAGSISYSPESDAVLDVLRDLLAASVGPALPSADHADAVQEAQRRVELRIPPGYRDADKAQSELPEGAGGDYLVWRQSMIEADRRDLPLAIVTGDEKEDWWWRHRSTLMGPRPELVREFAQRSAHRLYLLRPLQLIENAGALNVTVSPEAATDVARAESRSRSAEWTPVAVHELLRRLDHEGREQADVIRFAAEHGGIATREEIYQIAGFAEERMLRGFTRPSARITRALQESGILDGDVEPVLTPHYDGGVTAVRFEIPLDVVEILSANDGPST